MTTWNEHNFLERLMPHLQHGDGSKRQTCPDSTTLSAFMENQLGGADRDAIAAHLAQCSECAELHDRLVSFAKATVVARDSEWENTEKRLAIWMSGFLDAHLTARQSADRTPAENSAKRWNWWHSWKFQWALSAVAALALVAGAALLLKPTLPWPTKEKQVAVQANLPAENPTTLPTGQTKTETAPEKAAATQQLGPIESSTAGREPPAMTAEAQQARSIHNLAGQGISNESSRRQPEQAMNSRATSSAGTVSQHEESAIARAETPPSAPPNVTALATRGPALATAPPVSANSRTTSSQQTPSVQLATEPLAAPGSSTGPLASAQPRSLPAGTTPSGSAAVHPASYRIEANTRLWIKVNSVNRQPDGSYTFRGALLEPVKQAGVVLLDQGSEIIGSGTVSQGKTSLLIAELVVGGTHYKLKNASSSVNAPAASAGSVRKSSGAAGGFVSGSAGKRSSGARNALPPGTSGPAVEFDAGRVLETFLASDSVYEKAPVGTGPSAAPQ
jgi:hypothetical protein